MTTKAEVIERVRRLANDNNLALPEKHSSSGGEPRTLDSIGRLELLVAIEQEFEVSLLDEELDAEQSLRDLDSIAALVLEKLGAG